MTLVGRRLRMFRCHIDPHIPPKPRQAFTFGTEHGQQEGEAYITPVGVYANVKVQDGVKWVWREYVIPHSNIECMELYPEEVEMKKRGKPEAV